MRSQERKRERVVLRFQLSHAENPKVRGGEYGTRSIAFTDRMHAFPGLLVLVACSSTRNNDTHEVKIIHRIGTPALKE